MNIWELDMIKMTHKSRGKHTLSIDGTGRTGLF